MQRREIDAVMNDHAGELMAVPGVTGVAVGALDDGTPCILVLVAETADALRRRVPGTLEGHPVKIVASGRIEPM